MTPVFASQKALRNSLTEDGGKLDRAPLPPRPLQANVSPLPESGSCVVPLNPADRIPCKTLSDIFELVLEEVRRPARNEEVNFPPYGGRVPNPWPTKQPFALSQVSRKWRAISQDNSRLWTTLRIWHTNHSEIWRAYISRSKPRKLDVEIYLPNHHYIEIWERPRIDNFKRIFKAIRGCSYRIQTLTIHAPNPATRIIINDAFERIHFTSLEELKVTQAGSQPLCFFGPMSFNRNVFRSLTLFSVMVNCDATSLEGIEDLNLFGSSGTLLDQDKLSHLTYPTIPPGPTMTRLKNITITGTYPIPEYHPGTNILMPLRPSFSIDRLTSLCLSQFRDNERRSITPAMTSLFEMACYAPSLRDLRLELFDEIAFDVFLTEMNKSATRPQYPCATCLHLTSVPTALVTPVFLDAFPELQCLWIIDSPGAPVLKLLEQDAALCPKLVVSSVDGREYSRSIVAATT